MSQARHWPTAPPNIIGAVLGSYRVTAELSRGGMGAVYRARHELLGRPAAVKLLHPDLTENDELVQRFFNEAKAATAIDHPGIIEVYDFGYTEDGRAYIIMEFLDGQPLARRIAEKGRLPQVEAAQIARGIASALTAAHAKGIVHRDLKPDNVFIIPDPDVPGGERPKVLDFGIAKLIEAHGVPDPDTRRTMTGVLMGTPMYMAPEQARAAGDIDHRADLYSLGCMLYELLVGQPPFVAEGAGEVITMQLFNQPVPPRERVANLSPELDRITLKLLEKDPADRFQSSAEVFDALGKLLGEARKSRAMTMQRRKLTEPPPDRGRRPLLYGLVALAIASAAIAGVVALRHGDDAPPPAPPAPAPPLVQQPVPVPPAPPPPPPPVEVEKSHPVTPIAKDPRGTRQTGPHTSKGTPIETNLEGP
jgi:serine/threonine protein kinase